MTTTTRTSATTVPAGVPTRSIDVARQVAALLGYTGAAVDDFANLATDKGSRTTVTMTARQAQSLVTAFEARPEVEPGGVVLAHVEVAEVLGAVALDQGRRGDGRVAVAAAASTNQEGSPR